MATEALTVWGIDEKGLEEMHRKILLTVIEKFAGGPVGLNLILLLPLWVRSQIPLQRSMSLTFFIWGFYKGHPEEG